MNKPIVSAKLVAVTQPTADCPASNAEDFMAFAARVSSGRDYKDRSEDYSGLLKYCIRNKHWSVFELSNAVVEVKAPRDISRQLIRHRSFSFQEFSQRYSDDIDFCNREIREQDPKNRQNSITSESIDHEGWQEDVVDLTRDVESIYKWWLNKGVAKECARVLLPEGLTMSSLYVQGSLRSFIHYIEVRDDPHVTQHEHVLLAREIKEAIRPAFPTVIGMLDESNG